MGWLEQAAAQAAEAQPVTAASLVPPVVPGRVLIVDGDYLAYFCAGNDECEPGRARQNAVDRLENMRSMSGSEKIVVHLTSSGSTKGDRYIIATAKPYQAQRSGSRRPKNWEYLREWMEGYSGELFTTKTWGTREADDGMAYHARVLGVDKACIATADKDLRMVQAWHLSWKCYTMTRVDEEFEVTGDDTKVYGHKWFWLQVLQGDTADNIPGLPKFVSPDGKAKPMGEKTAEKFLESAKGDDDALLIVAALYRTYYGDGWADALVEQMALLWMRLDKDAAVDNCVLELQHTVTWGELLDQVNDAGLRLCARVEQQKAEVAALGTPKG